MAFIEEACVGEGESWLQGQAAYADIPKALDIIAGKLDPRANQQRSDLNINHAKFILRKIIGTLADVRQVGQFTSDAKFYLPQAQMFNQITRAVALESDFAGALRQALQYMGISANGYLWPRWVRTNGGYGEEMVEFLSLGLLDVLPVQMPINNKLQGSYSVTVIVFMPVWESHGKFPEFASGLQPVARRRYTSTVSGRRLDLAEKFRYGEYGGSWANLFCEIRYTFINDLSINETNSDGVSGHELPMGEWHVDAEGKPTLPKNSWSYKVPYVGQKIPYIQAGKRMERTAEPEDCLLYPHKRLIITSKGMKQPMYDGPAKDLHGMFPVARYCADDWVTEPCGFSLIHDIESIERARQTLERGMDQIAQHRTDPGLIYDRSMGMPDTAAERLDPFEPRKRVGIDGDVTKLINTVAPQWLLEVPKWIEDAIQYYLKSEDAQLGLNEMQNLLEFKANLSNPDMDKALSFVGPLVKDISGGMERSTVDIWKMLKVMIPQYMTTARVMQYVGPDGLTPETFDFDPESIVPSHGADEVNLKAPYDPTKPVREQFVIPGDSVYTRIERLKHFVKNLRLITVPHTMHEITQTQEQVKYMTLYGRGFPISSYDVAKKLNLENYGEIDGATMHDRWLNEQKEKLIMQAQAAQLMKALGLGPPEESQQGTGPKGGAKGTGGRSPSGGQAPKLKAKRDASTGGIRPVTSQSG